jgi:hypothetical protein
MLLRSLSDWLSKAAQVAFASTHLVLMEDGRSNSSIFAEYVTEHKMEARLDDKARIL